MKIDKFIKGLRIVMILIFFAWGVSWISVKAHHKELRKRNFIENMVVEAGNLPAIIRQWFKAINGNPEISKKIKISKELYKIGEFPKKSVINDSLYLLYYKYIGNNNGKVYLQNIKHGDTAFTWDIPFIEIMDDLNRIDKYLKNQYLTDSLPLNLSLKIKKNITSIAIRSPIISNDSSLIFHCGTSYLYKIDKNSKILWKSKRLVHHSIELDNNSNIWTCSIDLHNKEAIFRAYREDAILCLSPNGEEKEFFPLTKIFKSNRLFKKLIGSSENPNNTYGLDPYHLNDVLPVNYNGEYWQRGDIFLSLRSQSMVFQYRPSIDSIIWYQQGLGLGQHDINIVNDSVISFFNNNIWFFRKNNNDLSSNIAFYDFKDDSTIFKYNNIFKSSYEGRQNQIFDKSLIIESTVESIFFILDSLGKVSGEFYIPYFSNPSRAMYPTWARVYLKKNNKFILQ